MKRCEYCGRENADDASACCECGEQLRGDTAAGAGQMPVERIATVQNEIEAELLEAELTDRRIPHTIVSHSDSAFDGLFQLYHGWGHVEAPGEYKDAVLSILEIIRQPSPDAPTNPPPDGD
jgi:hypothetical protein